MSNKIFIPSRDYWVCTQSTHSLENGTFKSFNNTLYLTWAMSTLDATFENVVIPKRSRKGFWGTNLHQTHDGFLMVQVEAARIRWNLFIRIQDTYYTINIIIHKTALTYCTYTRLPPWCIKWGCVHRKCFWARCTMGPGILASKGEHPSFLCRQRAFSTMRSERGIPCYVEKECSDDKEGRSYFACYCWCLWNNSDHTFILDSSLSWIEFLYAVLDFHLKISSVPYLQNIMLVQTPLRQAVLTNSVFQSVFDKWPGLGITGCALNEDCPLTLQRNWYRMEGVHVTAPLFLRPDTIWNGETVRHI